MIHAKPPTRVSQVRSVLRVGSGPRAQNVTEKISHITELMPLGFGDIKYRTKSTNVPSGPLSLGRGLGCVMVIVGSDWIGSSRVESGRVGSTGLKQNGKKSHIGNISYDANINFPGWQASRSDPLDKIGNLRDTHERFYKLFSIHVRCYLVTRSPL